MKKPLSRVRRVAVLGAVLTLLGTVHPAQASTAQAGTCKLTWSKYNDDFIELIVRCTPNNPRDKFRGINLWADDQFDDDLIAVETFSCASAAEIRFLESQGRLDEDFGDRDEIYAGVWFRKADGSGSYGIQTNTVAGYWGHLFHDFEPPSPRSPIC